MGKGRVTATASQRCLPFHDVAGPALLFSHLSDLALWPVAGCWPRPCSHRLCTPPCSSQALCLAQVCCFVVCPVSRGASALAVGPC